MKICKKIALITMLCLILTAFNVYAIDENNTPTETIAEVTMVPSSTTVKAGDTVKITIFAKYEKGVEGVDATLEYDKTKLEMTGLKTLNYYYSFSGTDDETGKFKFTVAYGDLGAPEETPKEAEIAVISFKVLDNVIDKEEIKIKLSEIEVGDPDGNSVTPEDEQTILTVVIEQEQEGGEPEGGSPEGGSPEGGEPEGGNPEGGEPEGGNPEAGEEKDPTTSGNPFNEAGLETYGLIVLIIVIVAFVSYRKCQKYKDVK